MSPRLLGILVAVLAILGGAALWLQHAQRADQPAAVAELGEPLVKGLQAANIASIRITAPGASVTLRREGERWVVAGDGDFPADLAKVRGLVVKALGLKVGQSERMSAADRVRLQLNEPSAAEGGGTLIEFYDAAGKPLAGLIVGGKYFKRTPDDPKSAKADGRFVLRPDATGTAIIVADPLEQSVAKRAEWLDHRALAAEEPVSIDVRHADGDHWRLERGPGADAKWRLVDAKPKEKLNDTTVLSVAAAAGGLDFADVVKRDPQREAQVLARPTVITTVTRDGLTYVVKVGAVEDQKRYAVGEIRGDTPGARKPVDGEKPEEAKARDKAFAERVARIQARRPTTGSLDGYALLIPDTTLADLTKKRADLLEKPPAKP